MFDLIALITAIVGLVGALAVWVFVFVSLRKTRRILEAYSDRRGHDAKAYSDRRDRDV